MPQSTSTHQPPPSPPQRPTAPLPRAASNAITRLERALRPAVAQ